MYAQAAILQGNEQITILKKRLIKKCLEDFKNERMPNPQTKPFLQRDVPYDYLLQLLENEPSFICILQNQLSRNNDIPVQWA